MAAINSIITRIKDLVGDEVTSIEGYKDLINSGFNYAADLIPSDSELWRSALIKASTDLSTIKASDSKVILVTREDSGGTDRVAKEVSLDYLKRGQGDPTSIYYNAGNYKNPIYSVSPRGTIEVKPDGGTVKIYVFKLEYVFLNKIWIF